MLQPFDVGEPQQRSLARRQTVEHYADIAAQVQPAFDAEIGRLVRLVQ
jgi:hypothetical protein